MRRFVIYWLPVIAACTAIFIQSSFPGPDVLPEMKGADKIAHGLVFGLLALLFYRAFQGGSPRPFGFSAATVSIFASGLYGLSDEIHQYFVPFRQADPLDVAADLAGAVIAVLIRRRLFRDGRSAAK